MVVVVVRKSVSGNGEEKSQVRRGNISTKRERKALSERLVQGRRRAREVCFIMYNFYLSTK
jgi:hypothetical protein